MVKAEAQTEVNLPKTPLTLQYPQNASLEAALAEAEARAGAQLAQVQLQVSAAEAELRDVRAQLQRQNEQHRELLGLKDRLEAEIATYRQLLEGGDGGFR